MLPHLDVLGGKKADVDKKSDMEMGSTIYVSTNYLSLFDTSDVDRVLSASDMREGDSSTK